MTTICNRTEFFLNGPATDESYVFNRDHENRDEVRKYLNTCWRKCGHLVGEADFRQKAMSDFNSHAWHLHLLRCLVEKGYDVQPALLEGPDIKLVINEKVVWIEAIAVKAGTKVDKVDSPPTKFAGAVPEDKIILRHTSGISEKFRKYQKWIDKRVIQDSDPYVIALNVGDVPSSDLVGKDELNYLERAVFGLGGEKWHMDIANSTIVAVTHEEKPIVNKPSNNAKVPTTFFRNEEYNRISAILYSTQHIVHVHRFSGSELKFLHNPLAENRIDLGIFRIGVECWVDDTGRLQRQRHSG